MKAHDFILLIILLLLCSTTQAASFQFWYTGAGVTQKVIKAICADFNRSQTKHVITCVNEGSESEKAMKSIAAYRAHRQPAIIQLYDINTTGALISGAMLPVSDVMQQAGYQVDWSEYLGSAINYYSDNKGKLYALPFNVSTPIMYVNDNMLIASNIYNVPVTWDEFGKTLKQLKDSGNSCPFITDLSPWIYLEQFSAVQGIPIASLHNGYYGLEPQYIFNESLHKSIMLDLKHWYDKHWMVLAEHTVSNYSVRSFASNKCAFLISSTGSYGAISIGAHAKNFHFSMYPIPYYQGTKPHNSLIGGGALWVMRGFNKQTYDGVAAFLHYVTTTQTQLKLNKATGYLPITNEAISRLNSTCRDSSLCRLNNVAMNSLNRQGNEDTKGVHLGFYIRFRHIWVSEIEKSFEGQQSIEDALNIAKMRGDSLLQRFNKIYQNTVK